MIWKIAKKEILLNLMTLKFAVGSIACVILTCVFVPILAADYCQRLEIYRKHVSDNENELRQVKVYRNIRHTVFRPPAVLSAFHAGLEKQITDSAKIEIEKVPELRVTEPKGNPYTALSHGFDIAMIFKMVIGVLALLVSFDVISGEREQGTLKLMLSGEVHRWRMLLGKILGGLVTLSAPVAIMLVTAVIILISSPRIALSGSEWCRLGFMFVVSLAFTSAMYLVGLLFSCLAKKSSLSMAFGLFVWIVFVIVVPNTSAQLATQMRPVQPQEQRESSMRTHNEAFSRELSDIKVDFSQSLITNDDHDAFGGYYRKIVDIYWLNAERKRNTRVVPVQLKYAAKFWDLEQRDLNTFLQQDTLTHRLSIFSPVSAFDHAMSILSESDLASFVHFFAAVRHHRNAVMEWMGDKTNQFSSASYFAGCTEAQSAAYTKLFLRVKQTEDEQAKVEAEKTLKEWERENLTTARSLDLKGFPWFRYQAKSWQTLGQILPDLIALFVMNLVLFALCFAALAGYDVR